MVIPALAPASRRIPWIDVGRGAALVAMAIYHFAWDMEFFGYAEPGMTAQGGWKLFARAIASSFLFLVGVSLVLAHGRGVRWQGFWRRWATVAGAAALISAATYVATPESFIFFGILHQIAVASLLGILFLRWPAAALLAGAALFFAALFFLRHDALNHPAFWWLGLSTANPRSNDYVPLFPWFGVVLLGMAGAKLAAHAGWLNRLAGVPAPRAAGPLAFAGRHSLAVYLLHQPALIGLLFLFSLIVPPPTRQPDASFLRACEASCVPARDGDFCARYCVCMLSELQTGGILGSVMEGANDVNTQSRVRETAGFCSAEAEFGAGPEGQP
ncbi:MAG TPA: DUF1624 domain-containing protein [Mesorhizobium sp.]|jgi:uncharacterized membrane protein|nr:DUF1624 domain-containing protein [Mesorhizobium sp.]